MQIKAWFTRLLEVGPSYGYFAEPATSILVVKERHLEQAKSLFADLQVQVVLSSRFLGGCVGTADGIRQYVSSKIDTWVQCLERLAEAARAYPQCNRNPETRQKLCGAHRWYRAAVV